VAPAVLVEVFVAYISPSMKEFYVLKALINYFWILIQSTTITRVGTLIMATLL
jgi:hypothetical protein